jgi:hypothetical protein
MGIGLSNASHPKPRGIFATENDVTFSRKTTSSRRWRAATAHSLKLIKMPMQKTCGLSSWSVKKTKI